MSTAPTLEAAVDQSPRVPPLRSAQGPASTIPSAALLQGGKAVTINHNGELYRLQATRQGKLILTK